MLGRLIPVIKTAQTFYGLHSKQLEEKGAPLDSEGSLPGILVQPPGLKTKFKEIENKFWIFLSFV